MSCMDNREKGYTLYKKGLKYKEIAEKLGVTESAVKSWATRYWKKGKVASEKVATKSKKVASQDATTKEPKHRGGQPGNVNGVGNKGGAPPGNQNAFKHGGYSAILFDTFDDDERSLIDQMEPDEEQLLVDEINLLTVREHRILHRINEYKDKSAVVSSVEKTEHRTADDETDYYLQTSSEASYSIILKLEEALTRCQAQKQRTIDTLNKIRMAKDDGKSRDIEDMYVIRKVVFGDDSDPNT